MTDTVFTWKIAQLERETADGYVFTAHWTVAAISSATNDEGEPYTASAYGSVGLQRPDNLIPYADLTEAIVIGWVKQALGGDEKVTKIQAALQAQVDEQRNPTKAAGVPWAG